MTVATAAKPDTAVAIRDESQALTPFQVIERVIASGDLAQMKPQERVDFYWRTCESLGLNPLTRPFEFINLNGKLTMYARKDATDQLRKINGVTVTAIAREKDESLGLITVNARGRAADGREDEASGVVNITGLSGEALANALMKAETKAKRRLTLSLVGLGFLDESEVDGAERVDVDPATGVITERAKPKSLLEAVQEQRQALAAAAPEPAAEQPQEQPAEVEGEATWLSDDPAPAPTIAEAIAAAAAGSELEGPASKEQLGELAKVFVGWDEALVKDGIRALFGREAISRPSAAQARAITVVADSVGQVAFLAGWREIAAAEGSAA